MTGFAGKLLRLVMVLWAGSLWALALWVAPLVFKLAPDRRAAGVVAAGLFQAQTYVTLALAVLALWRFGRQRFRAIQVAATLLAINEFIIKKIFEYVRVKGDFAGLSFSAWHRLSAAIYVAACVAAVLVVWQDDFG